MKFLTKHTDYAVRALLRLSLEPDRFMPSSEISREEKIPAHFLRRILQALIKDKLLLSKEGIAGGVKLNRRPEDISIIDVMKLFQGEFRLSECMFRRQACPNRPDCVLRSRICQIERRFEAEFRGITIGTLRSDLRKRQGR
jgi:Rrf2 family protein